MLQLTLLICRKRSVNIKALTLGKSYAAGNFLVVIHWHIDAILNHGQPNLILVEAINYAATLLLAQALSALSNTRERELK
jgi:hypothetical protein